MRPSPNVQRWRVVVGAAGVGLLLLGAAVCTGWYVHSVRLVQVYTDLVAMKFNTALCFALLGGAIVLWAMDRARGSIVLAGAVLLLSGLILLQHIFEAVLGIDVSFGIDTLFVRPFTYRTGETPGRISVYGSGAFVALALAMVLQRASARMVWGLVSVFALCAGVQVVAAAGLLGYATGFHLPTAGGTSMAVHTTLGLMVASWAVLGVNWPRAEPRPRALIDAILLAPVAVTMFAAVMLLWVFAGTGSPGSAASHRPVWPVVTVLAVAAWLVAGGLLLARVGFERAAAMRDANAKLLAEIAHREVLESEQRLLVRELDHRVRNTLAQVLSLADSTAQASDDLKQFHEVFGERIRALSRAHAVLASSRHEDVDLRTFLSAVLEPFVTRADPGIMLSGEPVLIPARAATPLCMVYYELAANASRHGALSRVSGRVDLSWRRLENGAGEGVEIRWKERGGPPVPADARAGFGVSLIRTIIPHELGGRTQLRFEPDGVECVVSFTSVRPPSSGDPARAVSVPPSRASGAAT